MHPVNETIEVKGSMKITQESWDAIFNKGKPKSDTVVIEETEEELR